MNNITIYILALGAFLTGTAELVVAGILHIIADDLGISIAFAGQLITAYSLAFAIGTPILMALTFRMGRKNLLVYSLIIFIIGCLISFLSLQYSILMISRLIMGVSAGVFTVVALSSVAKLVPSERTGSAIGTIVLGVSAAMVLGVPLGVAITNWAGWQIIFALLGAVSLLIMLVMIRLLPQIEGDAPVSFKQQFVVLGNLVIVSSLLISFFLSTSHAIMYSYIAPFFKTILYMDTSNISMMMFVLGVFGVIGSRLGGFGVDKWGTAQMISIGLAIHALFLALIPVFSAWIIFGLVLITVWVFSMFMTVPAIQTYFIQQAPQSTNLVLGLNTSILHLGVAIGAGIGGFVIDSTATVLYNPWVASSFGALSLLIAIITFSIQRKKGYSLLT